MTLAERLARLEALNLPELADHLKAIGRQLERAEERCSRTLPSWQQFDPAWPTDQARSTGSRPATFRPQNPGGGDHTII